MDQIHVPIQKNCSTRIMRTLYAFLGLFLQFYRPNINVLTTFCQYFIIRYILTHQGRVTHTCVSKLTIIGSDNILLPGRRQDNIWTNSGILLSHTSGTNLSEILSKIQTFSFKKMHLKIPSGKRRPFCLGLNVLIIQQKITHIPCSLCSFSAMMSLPVAPFTNIV